MPPAKRNKPRNVGSMGLTFNPRDGEYVRATFEVGSETLTAEQVNDAAATALTDAIRKLFDVYDRIEELMEGDDADE